MICKSFFALFTLFLPLFLFGCDYFPYTPDLSGLPEWKTVPSDGFALSRPRIISPDGQIFELAKEEDTVPYNESVKFIGVYNGYPISYYPELSSTDLIVVYDFEFGHSRVYEKIDFPVNVPEWKETPDGSGIISPDGQVFELAIEEGLVPYNESSKIIGVCNGYFIRSYPGLSTTDLVVYYFGSTNSGSVYKKKDTPVNK